jgi:predicted exporter
MRKFRSFCNSKHLRVFAFAWLAVVVGILGALVCIIPGSKVETDILALLPAGVAPENVRPRVAAITQRVNNQLVFLVSSAKGSEGARAANFFFKELQTFSELQDVEGPVTSEQQQAYGKFFFTYRAQLLDEATCAKLSSPEDYARHILGQIYSPFSGVSSAEIANDPLLLTRARQISASSNFQFKDGWIAATDAEGRVWYFITAELSKTSFNLTTTRPLVERLDALDVSLSREFPGAAVLRHGALFYSDYAANSAARDISTIGLGSLVGIVVLLLLFFRSVRPLLLTLLSMAVGFAAGTLALLGLFGNAHIITLTLGISVVGLSLDYAIHYLAGHAFDPEGESSFAVLGRLFPSLAMALFTTVLAYSMLLLAPFPALQQLAVFAASGLSAAFLTVVLWFPFLSRKSVRRGGQGLFEGPVAGWLRLWRENKFLRYGLPAFLVVVSGGSVFWATVDDDIARLQGFPERFRENERQIAALSGQGNSPSFFIVHADTPEATLVSLERLGCLLEQGVGDKFRGTGRLSLQLASLARQREVFALVSAAYPKVAAVLREADIPVSEKSPYAFAPLLPGDWLRSPVSRGYRLLWFQDAVSGKDATALPFSKRPAMAVLPVRTSDNLAMHALATQVPGAHWINQRADFSRVFAVHRYQLTCFLGVALVLIALLFSIRFGLRDGLRNTLPILLAVGSAFGALTLAGEPLNLFALLALILVLGIGIDYTLFLSNPHGHPGSILRAVFVAALTTQLTFGMLAFSETPVISTFGILLATGIFTAFLLAPLAQPVARHN